MCDNEAGAGVTGSMNTIIYSRGDVKSEQKVIFQWKVCVSCTWCIRKFFKNVAKLNNEIKVVPVLIIIATFLHIRMIDPA